MSEPRRRTNRLVSALDSTRPRVNKKLAKRPCHARGAYFSPYNDLLRRQMRPGPVGSSNLAG
jgi:hypothetical protein